MIIPLPIDEPSELLLIRNLPLFPVEGVFPRRHTQFVPFRHTMMVIIITHCSSLEVFRFTAKVLLSLVMGVSGSAWIQAQEQLPEADDSFEKWLNQDVTFIVTEEEEEVFSNLATLRRRNAS